MITAADVTAALRGLGVASGDVLFVHSGLKGALRLVGATREEKLGTLTGGLLGAVADGVLGVPTFTYSFTRDEAFDVRASPSTVGVLTEHVRTLPAARRTTDPLFSCAFVGKVPEPWASRLFTVGDHDCFGAHSTFGYLAQADAQLAFLGVGFDQCTFVHHVEQRVGVPYRRPKDFRGTVIDGGRRQEVTARFNVRDLEADVVSHFDPLGEALLAAGHARSARVADGPSLLVVRAGAVAAEVERRLAEDPDFLLRRGHARTPAR